MKTCELKEILNKELPFFVVDEVAKQGYLDNSGIICQGSGDKILFTLDLTDNAVDFAIEKRIGIIVTHHPVIFSSIRKVDGVLLKAIQNRIGIISAHLPADYASKGVDYHLAKALGAENETYLEDLGNGCKYGRIFEIKDTTLKDFSKFVKEKLNAKNISVFGKEKTIKRVVTLCGAGLQEETLPKLKDVDVIVSADIRHHVLLKILEDKKCVVMPTHYATENYGFKQIALSFKSLLKEQVFYLDNDLLL